MAILLAGAAVAAAAVTARAAIVGSGASTDWQAAVRQEVKRGAAIVEDVRFVYNDEGAVAFIIATAEVRAEEFDRQAEQLSGGDAELLRVEAETQRTLAEALLDSSEIAQDPAYRLEGGGFDITRRLIDNRNRFPDLVAVNPDDPQASGDASSRKAIRLMTSIVPISLAFLFGALAQGLGLGRRVFIVIGIVTLAAGAILAIVVEVTL